MQPPNLRLGRARSWATRAFALALVCAFPAQAAGQPSDSAGLEESVAVIELYIGAEPSPKTPEYAAQTAEGLSQAPKYALLTKDDARRQLQGKISGPTKLPADKLQAAQADLKAASDLIFNFKMKKGMPALEQLLRTLDELASKYGLVPELGDLYKKALDNMATGYFQDGDSKKLEAALDRSLRFSQLDVKLDEETVHPHIIKAAKKVKKKLNAARTASLTVNSKPEGAEVFLQGALLEGKQTPATIEQLIPGEVSVQIRKDGQMSGVRKVTLEADGTAEVEFDLEYDQAMTFGGDKFGITFLDQATFEARAADFAADVGKKLQVDLVLLVGVVKRDDEDMLEGHLFKVATKTQDLPKPFSKLVNPNVFSKKRVNQLAKYVITGTEPISRPLEWYELWPGWVGVGLGVVFLAAGGGLWSTYESTLEKVLCTDAPPKCDPYETRVNLASDAKLYRGLGGAGFILGGAGIVAGILSFALLEWEDEGEDEAYYEPKSPRLQIVGPAVMPDGSPGLGATISF